MKLSKLGSFVSLCGLTLCLSCATKNVEKPKQKTGERTVSQPTECIKGCMPNEDDKCVIEAVVSDGAALETETVECDPKCCEAGATFIDDGGVDTDKDGIYDGADECVDQAEDFDGFRDKDGCPDLDNDNDKIPDVDDQCPLDAEEPNGVDDEDGCPD